MNCIVSTITDTYYSYRHESSHDREAPNIPNDALTMAHLRVPIGPAYRIPRSRHGTDGHLRRAVDRGGQRRRGRGRAPAGRAGLCSCLICPAKAKLRRPTCIFDWYCASRILVMRGNSGLFRFMLRGYSKFGCALLRIGKRGLVGYPEWQCGFDTHLTKCLL